MVNDEALAHLIHSPSSQKYAVENGSDFNSDSDKSNGYQSPLVNKSCVSCNDKIEEAKEDSTEVARKPSSTTIPMSKRASSRTFHRKLTGINEAISDCRAAEIEERGNQPAALPRGISKQANTLTIRRTGSSNKSKTVFDLFGEDAFKGAMKSEHEMMRSQNRKMPIELSWEDDPEFCTQVQQVEEMGDDDDDQSQVLNGSHFESNSTGGIPIQFSRDDAKISLIKQKSNLTVSSDMMDKMREDGDMFPGDSGYSLKIPQQPPISARVLYQPIDCSAKTSRKYHRESISSTAIGTPTDEPKEHGKELDAEWRQQTGLDIQAIGKRLGHKHQKNMAKGEWGVGLEDPWRIRGRMCLFLIILGILQGTTAAVIDLCINEMYHARTYLVKDRGFASGFTIYTAFMMVGTILSALITAWFAPDVAGSGIPTMKWILGTDDIQTKAATRFTLKNWLVKGIGLILAGGSGLNIGREGPFVHMSGMLSFILLSNFDFFGSIYSSSALLRQALVASTSLGVSSVFSATIGGVLLAIEITSTYYLVAQYFKGFLAAVSGAASVRVLEWIVEGENNAKKEVVATSFTYQSYSMFEIVAFLLLGLAGGLLGPLYGSSRLWFLSKCRKWGHWHLKNNPKGPERNKFLVSSVLQAASVAFFTAILSYPLGEYNQLGPFEMYADLLGNNLPSRWSNENGMHWSSLSISFVTRWTTAVIGTSICIPAGDFIQTAVLGAVLGRIVGELVSLFFPSSRPAVYALIGSATFSGGATQSLSAAVVLMEFTGSFLLELPVLMAMLIAYAISRSQGLNMYDSVMKLNGLKSLQGLKFDREAASRQCASDVMITNFKALRSDPTVNDVICLLEEDKTGLTRKDFPVVSDYHSMHFLGIISRNHLVNLIRECSQNNQAFTSHIQSRLPNERKSFVNESESVCISRTFQSIYSNIRHHSIGFSRGGSVNRSLSPGRVSESGIGSPQRRHSISGRLNLAMLHESGWDENRLKDTAQTRFLAKVIDLITEDQRGTIFIDPSTWTVPENMSLGHLHVLFELLRATRLFVVTAGQLRGIITRDRIYDALNATNLSSNGNRNESDSQA